MYFSLIGRGAGPFDYWRQSKANQRGEFGGKYMTKARSSNRERRWGFDL